MREGMIVYYKVVDLDQYPTKYQLEIIARELENAGYKVLRHGGYIEVYGNVANMVVLQGIQREIVHITNENTPIVFDFIDWLYEMKIEKTKVALRSQFPFNLNHGYNYLIIEREKDSVDTDE
mgnify:CR=1 FL=1